MFTATIKMTKTAERLKPHQNQYHEHSDKTADKYHDFKYQSSSRSSWFLRKELLQQISTMTHKHHEQRCTSR